MNLDQHLIIARFALQFESVPGACVRSVVTWGRWPTINGLSLMQCTLHSIRRTENGCAATVIQTSTSG